MPGDEPEVVEVVINTPKPDVPEQPQLRQSLRKRKSVGSTPEADGPTGGNTDSNKKSRRTKMSTQRSPVKGTQTPVTPQTSGRPVPILATPILSAPGTRPVQAPPASAAPGDPNKVLLDQMSSMFGDLSIRLGNMEKNLGGRLDVVESGLETRFVGIEDKIESKFTRVTAVVGGVSKKVDNLKDRLDRNDMELDGRIEKVLDRKIRGNRDNVPPAMRSRIRAMPLALSGPVMPSSEALNAPSQGPGPGSRLAENY